MKSKKFNKDVLKQLTDYDENDIVTISGIWSDSIEDLLPDEKFKIIINEHSYNDKNKSFHDLIFLDIDEQKYYYIGYQQSLSSSVYYSPFDDYDDYVECLEVKIEQKEVTVIKTFWEYI